MKCIEHSIIIPVYGNEKLLFNLLDSLLPTLDDKCEVIIVDDGHKDIKINKKKLPDFIKYISNDINLGYTKTINNGIKNSSGKYITTINSDIIVSPNWLIKTRMTISKYPNFGIIGSKLIYPDSGLIQHAGIGFGEDFNFHIFKMISPSSHLINEIKERQAVTDAFATIRRKVLEKIGGYTEQYINGHGDLDLCMKIKNEGYKVIYDPNIYGYHKTAASKEPRFIGSNEGKELFYKMWKKNIKDETSYFFNLSLQQFKKTGGTIPKQAYIVNISRKSPNKFLNSFLKLSNIETIQIFDYTSYVKNSPKYLQKLNIDLIEVLPFSYLQLDLPIIYIVDFYPSIEFNVFWSKYRKNQNDIVFDAGFNLRYLKDIVHSSKS